MNFVSRSSLEGSGLLKDSEESMDMFPEVLKVLTLSQYLFLVFL